LAGREIKTTLPVTTPAPAGHNQPNSHESFLGANYMEPYIITIDNVGAADTLKRALDDYIYKRSQDKWHEQWLMNIVRSLDKFIEKNAEVESEE
jgi:hypothetical protein